MSNLDLYVLSQELNNVLQDGFISNIYNIPNTNLLRLKCRTKEGSRTVIVDPKTRVNISDFTYPSPSQPSQFIFSIRKYMKGRRILRVYQHNFDRVLVFELRSTEGPNWLFVVEFFAGGNFILVDSDGNTLVAQKYKKYRDRAILPKKPYTFPIERGVGLWDLTVDDFKNIIREIDVPNKNDNSEEKIEIEEEFVDSDSEQEESIDLEGEFEEVIESVYEFDDDFEEIIDLNLDQKIESGQKPPKNKKEQKRLARIQERIDQDKKGKKPKKKKQKKPMKMDLVRLIARSINLGGYIAEEICLRAQYDKNLMPDDVSDDDIPKIFEKIGEVISILKNSEFSPRIIKNKEGEIVRYEPFALELFADSEIFEHDEKPTLNQAIDEYYAGSLSDILYAGDLKESKKQLTKHEKILKSQLEQIENYTKKGDIYTRYGHLIYQYMREIDGLISIVMNQRREKDLPWKEISKRLITGKEQKIPECLIYNRIFEKDVMIQVNLMEKVGDEEVIQTIKLDLKMNANENAQQYYEKAGKMKYKIKGAEKAIENSKARVKKQLKKKQRVESKKISLLQKPSAKWYERFRWFKSSDEFLVIGGRDASSNEAIVKKYMNNNDLFFHTNVRGASSCIIKNDENREIPLTTINETAVFAACYSSAWKNGWGAADIYNVKPEQVSKTPKAGEYITKGSFIINGEKNFLEKPILKLAIGIQMVPTNLAGFDPNSLISVNIDEENGGFEKFFPIKNEDGEDVQYFGRVLSAPKSIMSRDTPFFVFIEPTQQQVKMSDLAKNIVNVIRKKMPTYMYKWLELVPIDSVIRILPTGGGNLIV